MKEVVVELYSDQKNGAVLKLPDREYPGVLIQGDTLTCFIEDLRETLEECETLPGGQDVRDGIRDILDRLESLRSRYNNAIGSE
jgi:hypothetical protein